MAQISAATFALACPPSTPQADLDAYIAEELTAARFEAHLACSTKRVFVAEADDAVVGYLMLSEERAPAEVSAMRPLGLQRLYVLQPYHGSGLAQALMARALQDAVDQGCDVLWLSVSVQNDRGLAFYRKHGFEVVGEQRFQVGADIHRDSVMCRRVEASADTPTDALATAR
ncbi:GNAT family N-acetyltransferase [Solimonas sp. C16B3]|uniref:GNAT family N-acetyltransferase n=1 Tax=Solimonas marina TaxID=2714601 RepID=A0A970BBC4_9GAMM|nr:GNAT family N-acetyltransferase [Solimonas marina]NKF24261.1 GNAT family N-acetyltransferase [Solimonas marina]